MYVCMGYSYGMLCIYTSNYGKIFIKKEEKNYDYKF